MTTSTTPNNPDHRTEVYWALWAFADQDTGLVMRVSGRPYVLSGTTDERRQALRSLSESDFYAVAWKRVPQRLSVVGPTCTAIRGAVLVSQLDDPAAVFAEVLEQMSPLPPQLRSIHGEYQPFRFNTPDEPRYLLTVVVESEDGRLVPQVTG